MKLMTNTYENIRPLLGHHEIPLDRGAEGAVSHTKNLFKQLTSPQEASDIPVTSVRGIYLGLEIGIRSAADNRDHDVVMALSDFLASGVEGRSPIDDFPENMARYYQPRLGESLRAAFSTGVESAIEERQPEILERYGDAMILAARCGFVDGRRILDSFVGGMHQEFHRKIPELLEMDGYYPTKEAFVRNLARAKASNLSGELVHFEKHRNSPDYDVIYETTDCAGPSDTSPPATIATVPGETYNRLVQAAAAAGGAPPAALHSPPPEQTRTMSMLTSSSLQ